MADQTYVRRVAVGDSHSAAVDSHGVLWTWGCSHAGRLGRPVTCQDSDQPASGADHNSDHKGHVLSHTLNVLGDGPTCTCPNGKPQPVEFFIEEDFDGDDIAVDDDASCQSDLSEQDILFTLPTPEHNHGGILCSDDAMNHFRLTLSAADVQNAVTESNDVRNGSRTTFTHQGEDCPSDIVSEFRSTSPTSDHRSQRSPLSHTSGESHLLRKILTSPDNGTTLRTQSPPLLPSPSLASVGQSPMTPPPGPVSHAPAVLGGPTNSPKMGRRGRSATISGFANPGPGPGSPNSSSGSRIVVTTASNLLESIAGQTVRESESPSNTTGVVVREMTSHGNSDSHIHMDGCIPKDVVNVGRRHHALSVTERHTVERQPCHYNGKVLAPLDADDLRARAISVTADLGEDQSSIATDPRMRRVSFASESHAALSVGSDNEAHSDSEHHNLAIDGSDTSQGHRDHNAASCISNLQSAKISPMGTPVPSVMDGRRSRALSRSAGDRLRHDAMCRLSSHRERERASSFTSDQHERHGRGGHGHGSSSSISSPAVSTRLGVRRITVTSTVTPTTSRDANPHGLLIQMRTPESPSALYSNDNLCRQDDNTSRRPSQTIGSERAPPALNLKLQSSSMGAECHGQLDTNSHQGQLTRNHHTLLSQTSPSTASWARLGSLTGTNSDAGSPNSVWATTGAVNHISEKGSINADNEGGDEGSSVAGECVEGVDSGSSVTISNSFSRVFVLSVATGAAHTAVLSKEGLLYTFGSGNYGQLGHGDSVLSHPVRSPWLVRSLADRLLPCVDVACGPFSTIVVTHVAGDSNGQDAATLWLCGQHRFPSTKDTRLHVLATSHEQVDLASEMIRIDPAPPDRRVVQRPNNADRSTKRNGGNKGSRHRRGQTSQLSWSSPHSHASLKASTTVSRRHGLPLLSRNKLGSSAASHDETNGTSESESKPRFVRVAAGRYHYAAISLGHDDMLDRSHRIAYTWGRGTQGQLGHGGAQLPLHEPNPKPVKALGHHDIVDVAAGDLHTVAVTGTGEVFAWGYYVGGGHGQMSQLAARDAGFIVNNIRALPKFVEMPSDLGGKPVNVFAGGSTSACVTNRGQVYTWGGSETDDNVPHSLGLYGSEKELAPPRVPLELTISDESEDEDESNSDSDSESKSMSHEGSESRSMAESKSESVLESDTKKLGASTDSDSVARDRAGITGADSYIHGDPDQPTHVHEELSLSALGLSMDYLTIVTRTHKDGRRRRQHRDRDHASDDHDPVPVLQDASLLPDRLLSLRQGGDATLTLSDSLSRDRSQRSIPGQIGSLGGYAVRSPLSGPTSETRIIMESVSAGSYSLGRFGTRTHRDRIAKAPEPRYSQPVYHQSPNRIDYTAPKGLVLSPTKIENVVVQKLPKLPPEITQGKQIFAGYKIRRTSKKRARKIAALVELSKVPVDVVEATPPVSYVALGASHSLIASVDGAIFSCGNDANALSSASKLVSGGDTQAQGHIATGKLGHGGTGHINNGSDSDVSGLELGIPRILSFAHSTRSGCGALPSPKT